MSERGRGESGYVCLCESVERGEEKVVYMVYMLLGRKG